MGKTRMAYGLASVLFLVAGVGIYFLFRDLGGLLFFTWVPSLEFVGSVHVRLPPSALANTLTHNTAGMFWIVSGILFFRFLWFHRPRAQGIYIACFCLIAAGLETAQLSARVSGTFDPLDLVFMGAGAFVESLVYNVIVRRKAE